jgi:large subunit ribosomal protein L4
MAETTNQTFKAATYTAGGTERERVDLPADLFDGTINMPVMHQAVKAYLANQRLGLAYTKTRGLVTGGNQKPWKQKGTGRARQGSRRAPHFVGGGTVFGPTGRKYNQTVPRQLRALARKSALNARAREGALIVIDNFNYDKPNTKQLVSLLGALGVPDKKVLILTDGMKENVFLSGRNLQRTHVMPYADV